MKQLKIFSQGFKLKFEKFLTGCDSIEELGLWNYDENGEMDVFYSADLTSIIVRLIVADGNITEKEVEYLNEIFGFQYTMEELTTIYDDCGGAIDNIFNVDAENGLNLLRSINEKLAEAYVDLIVDICDIVMESDGIDAAELQLAQQIKDWAKK